MTKRIYLSPPHMGGQEQQFIQDAFATNWIAPLGPNVDAFEKELAAMAGMAGGVALSSGTAAIHLALKYLGVGPGDHVLCSTLTFSASCNPIVYEKAVPVFVDADAESWNMSPEALNKAISDLQKKSNKPKAAVVVDLYGRSADYDRLLPILDLAGIPVIEDAAEALGSTYKGRWCGSFGKFGIFSFNGNKIITTSGGGMVVSNDAEALRTIRFWATQSRDPARHYEHSQIGYNYRMSNVLAGIGRGQLKVLKDRVEQKRLIHNRYREAFGDIAEIDFMPCLDGCYSNDWLTVIILKSGSAVNPDTVMDALEANNIEARPVWKPMHLQPVFTDCPFYSHLDTGSIAEDLFNRGVCLPSGTQMTDDEQDRVIRIIRGLLW